MVFFSDFFNVPESAIDAYGAFNISLINDLPLFIDPFLIFSNQSQEYQDLHKSMLNYVKFLKEKADKGGLNTGNLKSWYHFPEVKQNWLGYSLFGNNGNGLGTKFAQAMATNISVVFSDIGDEKITKSSHIEKAVLFKIGVGKDNISDFTCNIIKDFLLRYTEKFALTHLQSHQIKRVKINKAYFDYKLERWMPKIYTLPFYRDFIILTPREILTKDETWINFHDMEGNFEAICSSIPNNELRSDILNYFKKNLVVDKRTNRVLKKDKEEAISKTINKFPIVFNYYIKYKESDTEGARIHANKNVNHVVKNINNKVKEIIDLLSKTNDFYTIPPESTFEDTRKRIIYLKDFIENNDGYRLFYNLDRAIKKESDLQLLFKLCWYGSPHDVNREVNNGRGPVDWAVSQGSNDKTLVEFKLASNSQLKKNLEHQVKVYEKANNTKQSFKVIAYFSEYEKISVESILRQLKLDEDESIILIDARKDNKISASKVK